MKNVWEQNTHHDLYEQNVLLSVKPVNLLLRLSFWSRPGSPPLASFLLATELTHRVGGAVTDGDACFVLRCSSRRPESVTGTSFEAPRHCHSNEIYKT